MIVFGAGASSYSGPCTPECPPLGNWLFEKLVEYKEGLPHKLVTEYGHIFRDNGFEAGMAAVAHLGSDAVIPVQRLTALYLSQFKIEHGNHYLRLMDGLRPDLGMGVTFGTLNYDLLLEQALDRVGWNSRYQTPPQANPWPEVSVLKLHGSSNFLPKLEQNIVFENNKFLQTTKYVEGLPMDFVDSHEKVQAWINEPRYRNLTPVLSVYGPGKTSPYNQGFIDYGQAYWRECLLKAKIIVLIGINYVPHDTHLFEPLATAPGVIAVVNPDYASYAPWIREQRKGDTFHLANAFEEIEKILSYAKLAFN